MSQPPDITPAPTTLSLDAFAARINRTRQFVAAGIQRGELPGYRVGRDYVIPAPAVELFMRGHWRPANLKVKPVRLSPKDFIRRRAGAA